MRGAEVYREGETCIQQVGGGDGLFGDFLGEGDKIITKETTFPALRYIFYHLIYYPLLNFDTVIIENVKKIIEMCFYFYSFCLIMILVISYFWDSLKCGKAGIYGPYLEYKSYSIIVIFLVCFLFCSIVMVPQ